VRSVAGAPLLNEHIRSGYDAVLSALRSHPAVRTVVAGSDGEAPSPTLLTTTAAELLAGRADLLVECFGPASIVVTYSDESELLAAAAAFDGQLTATIHAVDDDPTAPILVDLLSRCAGRVVWNGWPTGVSVTWAMQHGGPWPATTTPTTTSVGTAAIGRFLRPVAYQAVPEALLPAALQDANPLRLPRRVNGHLELL
jgi:NADP-dependent aldehyde dehydrogenase